MLKSLFLFKGRYYAGIDIPWYVSESAIKAEGRKQGFTAIEIHPKSHPLPVNPLETEQIRYRDGWEEWITGVYAGRERGVALPAEYFYWWITPIQLYESYPHLDNPGFHYPWATDQPPGESPPMTPPMMPPQPEPPQTAPETPLDPRLPLPTATENGSQTAAAGFTIATLAGLALGTRFLATRRRR